MHISRRDLLKSLGMTAAAGSVLEAADKARAKRDDPANDKTLSPFFCSPIDK